MTQALHRSARGAQWTVVRRTIWLLVCATGCYSYAPIQIAALQPGTEVRARIGLASAQQIAVLLGTPDARLLVGTVVHSGADTLLLEVPTAHRVAVSGGTMTLRQRVGIARPDVLELEARTYNRRRTTLVAGAAAVIVGSVLVKTLVLDPGKERLPTDPGGPELRPRN